MARHRGRPGRRSHGAGAQRRQQHHPDDRLPGRLPPVRTLQRGARREDRSRAHGDDARLRPDHRRRRAGRAHDVDLRGPREPADAGDRQQGPRRPGRRDRTSRQLPRVPRRHRRRRARRPDRAPGAALRRRDAPGGLRDLDHERRRGGRRRDRDRRPLPRARRADRDGLVVPADGRARRGRSDRCGHPLLRDLRRTVLQGREPAPRARRRQQRARGGAVPHAVRRSGHDRAAGRPADRQQAAPGQGHDDADDGRPAQPGGRRVPAEGRRQRQARRGRPEGPRDRRDRGAASRRLRSSSSGSTRTPGSSRARWTWTTVA